MLAAIFGASGAGKTTALTFLGRLTAAPIGAVLFTGRILPAAANWHRVESPPPP